LIKLTKTVAATITWPIVAVWNMTSALLIIFRLLKEQKSQTEKHSQALLSMKQMPIKKQKQKA